MLFRSAVSRALARPIAMFVDEADEESIGASIDAGVSAYVVDGFAPHRIRSILDLAIRRFAAAGGDAIYIDDATATSDMISPAMYERFSLPYMKAMVDEIHRLKHKAILIYFGGIMDRLELIAATGADGLLPEASMKGFVNDTAEIARQIGRAHV